MGVSFYHGFLLKNDLTVGANNLFNRTTALPEGCLFHGIPLCHCAVECHGLQRVAFIKYPIAHTRYLIADDNTRQVIAIGECFTSDTRYAIGNFDARQAAAFRKQIIRNRCQAVRKLYRRQLGTGIEHTDAHGDNPFTDHKLRHVAAAAECAKTNGCHTVGNFHACQRAAIAECSFLNGRDTVSNHKLRHTLTLFKCARTNICNAVRNFDACQSDTVLEGILADLRHLTADHNVRQFVTI